MEESRCCWPTSMSDLPEGILLDIIARAPVKTIVICKCVSKTWFNLLSLPYFAKLQFQKSICNKKLLTGASTTSSSSASPHWEEEIYQFDHEEDVCLQQFLHPAKIDGHWVSITFGSCNGMLLLSDKADKLHVYNPILKESVELLPAKSVTCWDRTCFGIGYSRVADTYKVVQFHRDLHARVCVLGGGQETMSWRDIVPNSHYKDGYDIKSEASYYAHGALHWWRTQNLDYHDMSAATTSCSIVCFDIETEQFSLLSPPQFFRFFRDFDYLYISTYLGVLGGCLAVLCNCGFEFSIWVMKHYGVQESWTKEITFKVHQSGFYITPLLMLKNGNLLFSGGRTYDPKEKTMKEGSGFTYLPSHVSYVPSLLSPKDV